MYEKAYTKFQSNLSSVATVFRSIAEHFNNWGLSPQTFFVRDLGHWLDWS